MSDGECYRLDRVWWWHIYVIPTVAAAHLSALHILTEAFGAFPSPPL